MMISWLRFEWDLASLPVDSAKNSAPYVLRTADKSEQDVVHKVASSAFSMDTAWGDARSYITDLITKSISEVFVPDIPSCVVLQHGSRIIGVSALNLGEVENNLPTGPCILHEYRSRGLASLLLQASLTTLRDAGLRRAYGIVREKTPAARFVYPKFGGVSLPWTADLSHSPKLAA
jgi:GNAT superfamily N-acetyltransferase